MSGRLRSILLSVSLMVVLGFLAWGWVPRFAPEGAVAAPRATTSAKATSTAKPSATSTADDSGNDSADDDSNPTPDNSAVWFAVAGAAVVSLVAGGIVLARR